MDSRLLDAALAAMASAHAPYSKFQVGAAILAEDGQIYAGCNVENAAYPEGSCAETGAIAAMVLGGGRRVQEIAVVGSGSDPCVPCGGCRQRIREFADAHTKIHVCGPDGAHRTFTCDELLPLSFGPGHLK